MSEEERFYALSTISDHLQDTNRLLERIADALDSIADSQPVPEAAASTGGSIPTGPRSPTADPSDAPAPAS